MDYILYIIIYLYRFISLQSEHDMLLFWWRMNLSQLNLTMSVLTPCFRPTAPVTSQPFLGVHVRRQAHARRNVTHLPFSYRMSRTALRPLIQTRRSSRPPDSTRNICRRLQRLSEIMRKFPLYLSSKPADPFLLLLLCYGCILHLVRVQL